MVFVRIQSSKLLRSKITKFFWISARLIDFDSRAVEDTSVRENSKFFWFSSHLIDFDSRAVEVTHARKNQIFICFFARLIVTLQAKDGENRHQLSEVEQDTECWE